MRREPQILGLCLALFMAQGSRSQDLLFEKVEGLQDSAQQVYAEFLFSKEYHQGVESLRQAIQLQGSRRQELLRKAEESFNGCLAGIQKVTKTFPDMMKQFTRTYQSDRGCLNTKVFQEGVVLFREVVEKLNRGDLLHARNRADLAYQKFRQTEVEARQAQILKAARELMTQAQNLGAERLAPKTFTAAQDALHQAEEAIKYQLDEPHPAGEATQATERLARRAIIISRWTDQFIQSEANWETLYLNFEEQITTLRAALHLSPVEQLNLEASFQGLQIELRRLYEDRERLRKQVGARDEQIGKLEADLQRLWNRTDELSNPEAQRRREEEAFYRNHQRFQYLQSLFTLEEGWVNSTEEGYVIRLVGLSYDSPEGEVLPYSYPLLDKVKNVLKESNCGSCEIRGHVASPEDSAANRILSQRLADSVKNYFLEQGSLTDFQIETMGVEADGDQELDNVLKLLQPIFWVDIRFPFTNHTTEK